MRKFVRRFALWFGVNTDYHVSATYNQDSHVGWSIVSLQLTIRPWLHRDNYRELVDAVNKEATRPSSTPSITSITKLGL